MLFRLLVAVTLTTVTSLSATVELDPIIPFQHISRVLLVGDEFFGLRGNNADQFSIPVNQLMAHVYNLDYSKLYDVISLDTTIFDTEYPCRSLRLARRALSHGGYVVLHEGSRCLYPAAGNFTFEEFLIGCGEFEIIESNKSDQCGSYTVGQTFLRENGALPPATYKIFQASLESSYKGKSYLNHNGRWQDRRTQYPFLSGDTFRAMADVDISDITSFSQENLWPGVSIFVKASDFTTFVDTIHPKIETCYVLIVHNSDGGIKSYDTRVTLDYLNAFLRHDNVLAVFAQALPFYVDSPKFRSLPLGLRNRHWQSAGWIMHYTRRFVDVDAESQTTRDTLVTTELHFTRGTRQRQIFHAIQGKDFISFSSRKMDPYPAVAPVYAGSKFVLEVPEFGLDNYRIWVALYLGCGLITESGPLDGLYEGLPVLILEPSQWETLEERDLVLAYENLIQTPDNTQKLWADYWIDEIRRTQALAYDYPSKCRDSRFHA